MTRELEFVRGFLPSDERTHVRIPFEVPEGIERMELEYSYPRFLSEDGPEGRAIEEENIVDLGLVDEAGRLRGWSGSERRSVYVSTGGASPGYCPGPLGRGTWAVALGLYKIRRGARVRVTLRLVDAEPVLLAGDPHVHTTNSDGAYPTAEVLRRCREAGLDFVALTDHNCVAQNAEIGRPESLIVIPGMEYTSYYGHANFFFRGDSDFRVDPLADGRAATAELFRAARAHGAAISLNHPHCDNCPWELGFDSVDFDMIELWNGPMKASDYRTLRWWQAALAGGRRLPIVGGSDTHRQEMLRSYGFPTTYVLAASRSRADVIDALAAGRSSISAQPRGLRVDIEVGGAGPGGEARLSPGLEGRVTATGARRGDIVKAIDASGCAFEWISPFDGDFTARFPARGGSRFYRAELWRRIASLPEPGLFALTNPVYLVDGE